MQPTTTFEAIDVLTRSGEQRDRCCALLDARGQDELDAGLVSDVLRVTGRVGATLETRRSLVELCALVRAIDAALQGRIDLEELRAGLALHAARTDRFSEFHDARVLLRTLAEVLGHATDDATTRAAHAQVALLHVELRAWLLGELTGRADGSIHHVGDAAPNVAPRDADPRSEFEVSDHPRLAAFDSLVEELLHGARDHPVTGLLGAAWIRGWSAVPVAGEMLGDDSDELGRLIAALATIDPRPTLLVQVERRRPSRWRLSGSTLVVGDHLRRSWELPADRVGIELAATERTGWSVLTTPTLEFAWVEGAGHHAVLGPSAFVEAACGGSPLEAMAAFREHVEQLAGDGDPPPLLHDIATSFGRLRRRSR